MATCAPRVVRHDRCDAICSYVSKETGIALEAIRGRGRAADIQHARVVAIVALRRLGMTVEAIGDYLERDHSTILHHLKRSEEDEELQLLALSAASSTGMLYEPAPMGPLLDVALRGYSAADMRAVEAYIYGVLLGGEERYGIELHHYADARTFIVRVNRWGKVVAAYECTAKEIAGFRRHPGTPWLSEPEALEAVLTLQGSEVEVLRPWIAYDQYTAYRGLRVLSDQPRLRAAVASALHAADLDGHIWRIGFHAERNGCALREEAQ